MQSRRTARLSLFLALLVASLGIAVTANAAGNTLRLDPATSSVSSGATFNVKVIQSATVPTSGTAVSITFNKAVLQIVGISRGAAFASAPLFIAADAPAIANANKKGKLQGVAAAYFPPGSVPAGDQEFITIQFKAIACGASPLAFAMSKQNDGMLDGRAKTYGASLKIESTTGATVDVCGAGASAPAGASSDPNSSASIDPNASIDPIASVEPSAGASEQPSQPAGGVVTPSQAPGAGSGDVTSEQQGWLTFGLAALAVAAAGLALFIVLMILITMAAAMIGGFLLLRSWSRARQADAAAAAATPVPAEAEGAATEAEAGTTEPGQTPGEAPAGQPQAAPAAKPVTRPTTA